METEFVPFELAVKLKELGWEGICFGFYSSRTKELHTHLPTESFLYEMHPQILAPLWQQAFDWLYKKTAKWIIPIPCDDKHLGNWYGVGKPYKTFEQARTACLEKLIELSTPPPTA